MIISIFKNEYAFLSNFAEININIKGDIWKTSEHLFMACKTIDENIRSRIRLAETPSKAKRIGRKIQLRPRWDFIKDGAMLWCLRQKFNINQNMKENLISTGDAILIEGNYWHDNYWGSCNCNKCKNKGLNKLGKLLMDVRFELIYT